MREGPPDPLEAQGEESPDHGTVVRVGGREHAGPRHARQELPAETLGEPAPPVLRSHEDPAELQLAPEGTEAPSARVKTSSRYSAPGAFSPAMAANAPSARR